MNPHHILDMFNSWLDVAMPWFAVGACFLAILGLIVCLIGLIAVGVDAYNDSKIARNEAKKRMHHNGSKPINPS